MEIKTQEEEDRRRMLEDVQSDKATISRALTQNRTLKDQLAELQNGFVKLVRLKISMSICLFLMTHFASAVIYYFYVSFVSVLPETTYHAPYPLSFPKLILCLNLPSFCFQLFIW